MSSIGLVHPLFEVGIEYLIQHDPKFFTHNNLPKNMTFFNEFKEGESIPVLFKIDGDFISMDSSAQPLTFKRNLFIKATKDVLLFSIDQIKWMQLPELFTGTLSLSIVQRGDDPNGLVELFANTIANQPQEQENLAAQAN